MHDSLDISFFSQEPIIERPLIPEGERGLALKFQKTEDLSPHLRNPALRIDRFVQTKIQHDPKIELDAEKFDSNPIISLVSKTGFLVLKNIKLHKSVLQSMDTFRINSSGEPSQDSANYSLGFHTDSDTDITLLNNNSQPRKNALWFTNNPTSDPLSVLQKDQSIENRWNNTPKNQKYAVSITNENIAILIAGRCFSGNKNLLHARVGGAGPMTATTIEKICFR